MPEAINTQRDFTYFIFFVFFSVFFLFAYLIIASFRALVIYFDRLIVTVRNLFSSSGKSV